MPKATRRCGPIIALLTLASGCLVYEPLEPILPLTDHCDANAPPVRSLDEHRHVEISTMTNRVSALPTCGVSGLEGPDGFMVLDVGANERWHIEASPAPDTDVLVYFLDTCDPRSAACRLVADRCPAGVAEEITVYSQTARTYYVGFDTHGGSSDFEAVVLRTECGDNTLEHGEGCDDGNLVDGDGCDAGCRVELTSAVNAEAEPNDWHGEANVFDLPLGGARTVKGEVGGMCDEDHYALIIPAGATVRAETFGSDGVTCPTGVSNTMLMLMDPVSATVHGAMSGACPFVEATIANAGEIHVMYRSTLLGPGAPTIPYTLAVTVTP